MPASQRVGAGTLSALRESMRRIVAVALLVTGCSSAASPRPSIAKIVVSPASVQIDTGKQVALTAQAYDAQGHLLSGQTMVWSTQDVSVASVSLEGTVTGNAAGQALIGAAAQGVSATAQISVVAPSPPATQKTPQGNNGDGGNGNSGGSGGGGSSGSGGSGSSGNGSGNGNDGNGNNGNGNGNGHGKHGNKGNGNG